LQTYQYGVAQKKIVMNEHDSTFLFEKITKHFDQKLPFAVYNKPNAKKIIGVFQADDVLYHVENYTEAGFVFAPFEGNEIVLIPENQSQIVVADVSVFQDVAGDLQWHEMDENENQSNFTNLVQKGIDAIHKGNFGKVVLSRKETILVSNFELTNVFQKLLQAYPTAFTYCFFHPKVGLWLGAFSEQLIRNYETRYSRFWSSS
jgi:isochorismate synthase